MIELLAFTKCSRWLAPLIGLVLGLAFSLKVIEPEGERNFTFVLIFGGLGLLAGLIILVSDQTEAQRDEQRAKSPGSDSQFRTIARALAVIALIVSVIPIVGLALSLCALAANIRHRGWPRIISGLGTLIGTAVLLLLLSNG